MEATRKEVEKLGALMQNEVSAMGEMRKLILVEVSTIKDTM